MSRAIKEVMKNNTTRGLSERKQGRMMRTGEAGITSSFSPLSNRTRSGRKASIGRSSIKKSNPGKYHDGHAGNNNGSLLNMSNEVVLMRSLSPSIQ